MNRFSKVFYVAVLIFVLACAFVACNTDSQQAGDLGKYYLVENGELVQDSYIELKSGKKWTDGEFSGTYKLNGTAITFFVDGEEFVSGTFSGGVLKIDFWGMEQEYRKTPPQSSIGSGQVDNKAKITAIQGGTVNGLELNLEIGDTIEDVDLSGMITTSKDCSWQLYTSRTATAADAIVTKMIVPKKGANTFYIVVTSSDGKINRTYTLNVWKNFFATLSFYVDVVLYDTDEVLTHTTYGAGPSCSVDGYEFQGWGCQGHYVVGDASFDATLTPCQYTVAFDANGGEDVSSKTATFDDSIWLPNAYRTGYTFLGWYYDGELYNGSMTYTFPHNVTMIARWQINSYNVKTISEDTNKGTVIEINENKTYGSSVNLKATTKTGYTFIGWYDGTTKISDDLNYTTTVPAYNVTYTAKWSKVTLDRNNTSAGTVSSLTSTYKVGDSATITASTNNGYTWVGWYDGDTKLTDELSYTFTMTAENKTYTAKWQANTYIITFDVNGGNALESNTQQVTYDSTYTLPTLTRDGYTFAGWYNGTTKYTNGTWNTVSNVTLTAKWTPITYTISYTLNGGSVSGNPSSYTIESEDIFLNNPTRTGYTFSGWTGTEIDFQSKNVTISNGSIGNRTYTANWQVNTYTITFDVNGGDELESNTQQVTYNSTYTLPTPTREGYTFAGWYDGSTKYTNGTWETASNVTLSAKWTPTSYSITYILNGGSVSSNPSTYTIESEDITIINPTKTGYTFLGWTGEDIIGPTLNVVIYAGSIGNRIYTANWQANTYTITFDVNGGNSLESNTQQVTYDSSYTLPTPKREGYTFLGWYNVETYVDSSLWLNNPCNISLTAKWTNFEESFNPIYDSSNNLVSFTYGEYPQTIKSSSVTIDESCQDSRGYYLGSDGAYYAKVTAKPFASGYTYTNGKTIISGYTYYFKVEPIKWKVLYNSDGTYLVMSNSILDSQCYYESSSERSGATDYQGNSTTITVYANNYKYSDIRTFLNTTFINNAFTSEEQNIIQTTIVDNSVSSTGYSSNSYACEDTQDKVFLLSASEATNTSYGFTSSTSSTYTRYAKGTDYAKAKGLYELTDSTLGQGYSLWWLRSPRSNNSSYLRSVYSSGTIDYYSNGWPTFSSSCGVRPALNINL